jgi:hypothetical protein
MSRFGYVVAGLLWSLLAAPFAALFLYLVWDAHQLGVNARHGTMVVRSCEAQDDPAYLPTRCVGRFESDDRSLLLDTITGYYERPPGEVVAGWVDVRDTTLLRHGVTTASRTVFVVVRAVVIAATFLPLVIGVAAALRPRRR